MTQARNADILCPASSAIQIAGSKVVIVLFYRCPGNLQLTKFNFNFSKTSLDKKVM